MSVKEIPWALMSRKMDRRSSESRGRARWSDEICSAITTCEALAYNGMGRTNVCETAGATEESLRIGQVAWWTRSIASGRFNRRRRRR